MYQTSKVALSAFAAVALLATASVDDAVGQTRQKQIEMKRMDPQLPKKPVRPSGGPVKPSGPGGLKAKDPVALPDFILHAGLPGNVNSGLPNSGFCKRKGAFGPADTIAFKVQFATQGTTAPAGGWGASSVRVKFTGGGSTSVPLVSPMWDGTMPVEVDIPAGCYGAGGCQFTIVIDPTNVVPETSNANNSTTKICAAPAG